MRPVRLLICFALIAAPAAAGAQDWRQAREYEVLLRSYDIAPATIRLRAGEPVRLRLINNGGNGYRLSADDFFAAAKLRSRDAASVAGGRVTIAPGETRELLLVPAAGRYRIASSNLLHRLLGMRGEILVE